MDLHDFIPQQRAILRDLACLASERANAERETELAFKTSREAAERKVQKSRQANAARVAAEREAAEREGQDSRQGIVARAEAELRGVERGFEEQRRSIRARSKSERAAAQQEHLQARYEALAAHERAKDEVEEAAREAERQSAAEAERLRTMLRDAAALLTSWKLPPHDAEAGTPAPPNLSAEPLDDVRARLSEADSHLEDFRKVSLGRIAREHRFLWLLLGLWLVCCGVAVVVATRKVPAAAAAAAGTLGVAWIAAAWLSARARAQARTFSLPLDQALSAAERSLKRCRERTAAEAKRRRAELERRLAADLQQAEDRYANLPAAIKQRREDDLRKAAEESDRLRAEVPRRRDAELRAAEEEQAQRLAEIEDRFQSKSQRIEEAYRRTIEESRSGRQMARETLVGRWREGLARIQALVAEIDAETRRMFPAWDEPAWEQWTPPQTVPPVLRFGEFPVEMDQIPGGIPDDEELRRLVPSRFTFPALLAVPERCSMLFRASEQGRDVAAEALQAMMLRFLTAFPPGKVRFTIVDPVGLGRNFAAFMHLADYDEQLVSSRIWTEAQHIERRLADLTEHMENVIQKYLRNEFQTITEYNAHAGEVAEPFHVLVVANFPVHFSEAAARRLVSIAGSGARCGVFTLLSVDAKQELPRGCHLKDLEQHAANLVWKDGRFVWDDADFARFPLSLDLPPAANAFTEILQAVGRKAKDANRVEVPFEVIAPPPDRWWTGDSGSGLDVPLGRAGATRLQYLKLGQGTAQHVLIAGRTGSGKSTLLHALITNLALLYSPDEVELYLIDFKKGVEFKTYASHELPHARVVAIESEREFGLSVLQRLDAELKQRGDHFRALGAQDLAAARRANGDSPLPRILLIVDEFQEFFVEDDKVAQEAALLLDRLVRQGRAFGIHVHLGSQTLSGAYSLARSTLGQMAVRIALQCSEADAHLILSEENSAARLLSRPGEAIYNDANGQLEGNHFFQVVWLSDERREEYLKEIRELVRKGRHVPPRPQIVFEGNSPADVAKNDLLDRLLRAEEWPAAAAPAHAWLGEAIAIKDPTAAVFRPQSGANLLMIGQQAEAGLALMAMALIGLAAQHAPADAEQGPGGARFYLFDGTPADSPHAGFLARLADVVPHPFRVAGWRDVPAVMGELAEQVERRQAAEAAGAAASYVLIYDLQRFRDLRKQEDDFGFSRPGEGAASPAQQFATLLREGPPLGIHTLVWCDTLASANRSLDRQALREFEMRVLFQMSAADSSNLIDTPQASKLGLHRAIFASEEQGLLEKFRPYGLPSASWLDWVRKQLNGRRTVVSGSAPLPGSPLNA